MIPALLSTAALVAGPLKCLPLACGCRVPPPITQARDSGATIFEGQVIEVHDTVIWRAIGPRLTHDRYEWEVITLSVSRGWSPALEDTVQVLTSTGMCGYSFDVGESYVVVANWFNAAESPDIPSFLETSICTQTTEAKRAAAIVDSLGPSLR